MTTTFTDRHGRQWDTKLTLASAQRIDNSDFSDVTKIKDWSFVNPTKPLFTEMVQNSSFLVAVIYAVVHPQVKKNLGTDALSAWTKDNPGLDFATAPDEELESYRQELFTDSFDGETLEKARDAFMEALADFFREHKTALSILARQRKVGIDRLNKRLASLEGDAQSMIEADVDRGVDLLASALKTRNKEELQKLLAD